MLLSDRLRVRKYAQRAYPQDYDHIIFTLVERRGMRDRVYKKTHDGQVTSDFNAKILHLSVTFYRVLLLSFPAIYHDYIFIRKY